MELPPTPSGSSRKCRCRRDSSSRLRSWPIPSLLLPPASYRPIRVHDGEERLGYRGADGEEGGGSADQARERHALKSTRTGQADLGKVRRFGDADVRVGGDELMLGLLDVGSALE